MTIGIILAVLVLLETANVFVRKIKNAGLRKIWSKGHKVIGGMIILLSVLHMVLTWPLLKQRPLAMYVLGGLMIVCAVAALLSYLFRKRLQQKWIVIHRGASIGLLICLAAHVILGITSLNQYQNAIKSIELQGISVEHTADGRYIGVCDAGYVYAKVEVVVKDGRLEAVNLLEHRTERGKAAEGIVNEMLTRQQLQVDTVSGATNSSKVIMQAAQNAVKGN